MEATLLAELWRQVEDLEVLEESKGNKLGTN